MIQVALEAIPLAFALSSGHSLCWIWWSRCSQRPQRFWHTLSLVDTASKVPFQMGISMPLLKNRNYEMGYNFAVWLHGMFHHHIQFFRVLVKSMAGSLSLVDKWANFWTLVIHHSETFCNYALSIGTNACVLVCNLLIGCVHVCIYAPLPSSKLLGTCLFESHQS